MRVPLAVVMLLPALAGCLGGDGGAPAADASLPSAADAGNETALGVGLVERALYDPWAAGETERVLFDGTVEAGECFLGAAVFSLGGGCVDINLADGALIPAGSAAVRIEADASQALKAGRYYSFFYTRVRTDDSQADAEPTDEKVHTFVYPLEPGEWDTPTAKRSHVDVGYWSYSDPEWGPTVFRGPVKTRVVVERDANWTAQPLPDPWSHPELHRVPQPGVLTLLDLNETWEPPPYALAATGVVPPPEWVRLQDVVPGDAAQVVFALQWESLDGCLPVETCEVYLHVRSGAGLMRGEGDAAAEKGAGHVLYVYDVPDEVQSDAPWANQSRTEVYPVISIACSPAPDAMPGCLGPSAGVSMRARLYAEAWRGPVDLEAVKARLGV